MWYCYGFVRKDLSHPQQVVQLGHAAYEAGLAFPPPSDRTPNLVVFGVDNEARLRQVAERLPAIGIRHRNFVEPDIGHQMTALVTEPVTGATRRNFARYSLLRARGEPV